MKRIEDDLLALTPAKVVAILSTVIGLFLTQGLINNNTEKLVTGLAVTFVPTVLTFLHELILVIRAHGHIVAGRAVNSASGAVLAQGSSITRQPVSKDPVNSERTVQVAVSSTSTPIFK